MIRTLSPGRNACADQSPRETTDAFTATATPGRPASASSSRSASNEVPAATDRRASLTKMSTALEVGGAVEGMRSVFPRPGATLGLLPPLRCSEACFPYGGTRRIRFEGFSDSSCPDLSLEPQARLNEAAQSKTRIGMVFNTKIDGQTLEQRLRDPIAFVATRDQPVVGTMRRVFTAFTDAKQWCDYRTHVARTRSKCRKKLSKLL